MFAPDYSGLAKTLFPSSASAKHFNLIAELRKDYGFCKTGSFNYPEPGDLAKRVRFQNEKYKKYINNYVQRY